MSAHTRSARGSRRDAGYLATACLYGAALLAVAVWPGWQVVPFLTSAAAPAMWLLVGLLALGMATRLFYAFDGRTRARAAGSYAMALVSLAVVARLIHDFPFDFGPLGPEWASVTRTALAVLAGVVVLRGLIAAVRIVRGRSSPHLAAGHA